MKLRHRCPAFTILELLVAIAVLAMIVGLLATAMSEASRLTVRGHKQMDLDSDARLVFDRIASDIRRLVPGDDIDAGFVTDDSGNSRPAFFTRVRGVGGTSSSVRPVSLVGYRLFQAGARNVGSPPLQLQRAAVASEWTGSFLTFSETPDLRRADGVFAFSDPGAFQSLSEQILRFSIRFLVEEEDGSYRLQALPPDRIESIRAFVIGLAMLDLRSQEILTSDQILSVASAFSNPAEGADFLTAWNSILTAPTFPPHGVPAGATTGLRVYQRTIPREL